ncbi:MAG TPA: DNA polymerase III subunit chi [Gammaproteobacteria bacterium]|nr:DNA polymerase III subunit chi [Gammaproteobacteria bacterium]
MTQVDFYILAAGDSERFACRLTEKAFRAGYRIHLNSATPEQMERLDNLLWSFRPGSFIPHRRSDLGDDKVPVVIGCGSEPETEIDLLINLADDTPSFFSRFQRLAEIVDQDPQRREKGRQRYRFYQERGYPLAYHNID